MNSRNTLIWFVVAVALFACIFIYDRFLRPTITPPSPILSGLHPSAMASIQVIPSNALKIEADKTNGVWVLTKPVVYPAQPAAVDALLSALQKLTPAIRLNAGELREQHNAEADYGFEPPRISLVLQEADGQRWQLQIGNRTAPGDQVYLRVVGIDGAFVAGADWLKYLPHSADDWRDTALVDFNDNMPDSIILTNGTKVVELHENTTNHLWTMTRPLPALANSGRITQALQSLVTAHAAQFVTDNGNGDLSSFDLQPADLTLWFGRGTNFLGALNVGASPTNDLSLVYAERQGSVPGTTLAWSAVLTTAKDPLAPWFGPVNSFRDPYLFELSTPVAEIQVRGGTNSGSFTLKRENTNGWSVVGEKFPVDQKNVQQFIQLLAGLRVTEFVKDVVTKPDLPTYGLAPPAREITLFSAADDTNAVIAQLLFGATETNEVFVRRPDEDSVYAISSEDYTQLPEAGWQFRERRIWNFSETNVVQITIHQNGKTRQFVHNGYNKWSLAPGSQGFYTPEAIEEIVHRLGKLTATAWLSSNMTNAEYFGFKPGNLSITLQLKNGAKDSVDFGKSGTETAIAAVTLDSQRWAFVFPPVLYQLVQSYLTVPPAQGAVSQ